MKKIILTSAVLMAIAAASYAQIVNQQGVQQYAEQNQFGANQNGAINQVQTPNNPNRTNYGNYAITFQGTSGSTGANTLVINQNDGSQGNRAGIGQVGGSGNNATINQNGGPDGLSGGATSVSATIGAAGQDGNFAGISQIGAANTALINQNNSSRRNTTETYQNGMGNTATTSQSNNSVSNSAFIYQGFVGQGLIGTAVSNAKASINQGQEATGNAALTGSPGAVSSTAIITQTASNVTAQIFQAGYGVPGRAEGVDARINQSAEGATGYIYQGIDGGAAISSRASLTQSSTNQYAEIRQGSGMGSSDNGSVATIIQNGASGVAASSVGITQGASGGTSERSQATITQTGGVVNGIAAITQGNGDGSSSSGDIATITQSGKNVNAFIGQSTTSGGDAHSKGKDNNASITQGEGVAGTGTADPKPAGLAVIYQGEVFLGGPPVVLEINRNTASINQVAGVGLRANIRQGGRGSSFQDGANTLYGLNDLTGTLVSMVGTMANDNTASIAQTSGNNHNANIYQNGLFNSAAVSQSNGNGHQALIIQTSNSQRAMAAINQSSSGSGNFATILQFTGANADGVGQYGNMATINQIAGSNNVAFIQQGVQGGNSISNDNLINVTQNGSNNFARFLQVGNNNVLNLIQNGSNNQVLNLAGDPNSYASQQGNNNQLTLTQNGSNLTFRYTQIGNNNVQIVEQTP